MTTEPVRIETPRSEDTTEFPARLEEVRPAVSHDIWEFRGRNTVSWETVSCRECR